MPIMMPIERDTISHICSDWAILPGPIRERNMRTRTRTARRAGAGGPARACGVTVCRCELESLEPRDFFHNHIYDLSLTHACALYPDEDRALQAR